MAPVVGDHANHDGGERERRLSLAEQVAPLLFEGALHLARLDVEQGLRALKDPAPDTRSSRS